MNIKRKFFLLFLIYLFIFCFLLNNPRKIYSQEYKSDYNVEYFLNEKFNNIETKVKFSIKITNLKSDVFVNRFSISFPKSLEINNITASDDKGEIKPNVNVDESKIKIDLEFTNPNIGRGSNNSFYLNFTQNNLFRVNGNVWEVILPTMDGSINGSYNVVVYLPQGTEKKISIAKPKPDQVIGNRIYWINPSAKTIYAVFGDDQNYEYEINYNLENDRITKVYTDITFPPDTLYQKVFLNKVEPLPVSVTVDEDGNYLGRYFLNPKEKKTIIAKGHVKVYTQARDDVLPVIKNLFSKQKNYLLTAQPMWLIDEKKLTEKQIKNISSLASAREIYQYVTSNLKYNYQRITKDVKRLGANDALLKPDLSVCTEFSDLFIALSREKGIYSREIQGYGFSNDEQLRPLSLASDILHSWPEYYDTSKNLWISLDPTWESTSGIDYFNSFDLNHIVLAIHGKKADYPLPAGMFKTEDSKDISIKATSSVLTDKVEILLEPVKLPQKINDKQIYKSQLSLKNNSNIFLYNVPLKIDSKLLDISLSNANIEILAPLEKKEIPFQYKAIYKNRKQTSPISIFVLDKKMFEGNILIYPYYFDLGIKFSLVILVVVTLLMILMFVRKVKYK